MRRSFLYVFLILYICECATLTLSFYRSKGGNKEIPCSRLFAGAYVLRRPGGSLMGLPSTPAALAPYDSLQSPGELRLARCFPEKRLFPTLRAPRDLYTLYVSSVPGGGCRHFRDYARPWLSTRIDRKIPLRFDLLLYFCRMHKRRPSSVCHDGHVHVHRSVYGYRLAAYSHWKTLFSRCNVDTSFFNWLPSSIGSYLFLHSYTGMKIYTTIYSIKCVLLRRVLHSRVTIPTPR
jgi:hypothetical protein